MHKVLKNTTRKAIATTRIAIPSMLCAMISANAWGAPVTFNVCCWVQIGTDWLTRVRSGDDPGCVKTIFEARARNID